MASPLSMFVSTLDSEKPDSPRLPAAGASAGHPVWFTALLPQMPTSLSWEGTQEKGKGRWEKPHSLWLHFCFGWKCNADNLRKGTEAYISLVLFLLAAQPTSSLSHGDSHAFFPARHCSFAHHLLCLWFPWFLPFFAIKFRIWGMTTISNPFFLSIGPF